MGKAEWLLTSPASGSGDANVNVTTTTAHTGRNVRTAVLAFKAANTPDALGYVNQAGAPEFVDIDDSASADKAGKVVTISGVSNSAKLTFSLGIGELDITLPNSYNANSISTANGAAIAGDPGAISEYPFSITINVPANDGLEVISRQIIVEDEAGHRDVCLLTLAAGDPYLIIEPEVIELDYLGTPVTVKVRSNTSWTIE